ncbi:hypothetical protein EVAR_22561_1 [Eumeta japonica]|uniref:Peptidase S1 domain-containing protein n=1 Tax=Eumeta variegata TaxID=151549 RepID=A0A4C1U7C9_EUMVA|nr:hypothetical protein EVAR_22561_1 [Eumeta japonica]
MSYSTTDVLITCVFIDIPLPRRVLLHPLFEIAALEPRATRAVPCPLAVLTTADPMRRRRPAPLQLHNRPVPHHTLAEYRRGAAASVVKFRSVSESYYPRGVISCWSLERNMISDEREAVPSRPNDTNFCRRPEAVLGAHSLYDRYESGRRILNVAQTVAHPDYDPGSHENDLALLRLANVVQFTEFEGGLDMGSGALKAIIHHRPFAP